MYVESLIYCTYNLVVIIREYLSGFTVVLYCLIYEEFISF